MSRNASNADKAGPLKLLVRLRLISSIPPGFIRMARSMPKQALKHEVSAK